MLHEYHCSYEEEYCSLLYHKGGDVLYCSYCRLQGVLHSDNVVYRQ